MEKKQSFKAGDVFTHNGVNYRVENEESEFSCVGCSLAVSCSQNRIGCGATSADNVFDNCKHDHVIFVKI